MAPIAELAGRPVAAAGLLSMHPNGYVREAAVRVLVRTGQPDALPFLIVRAADWVEQVRTPAQAGVEALLPTAGADELLRAAALLETMTDVEARAAEFSRAMRQRIAPQFDTPELLEALTHSDSHVRRLAAEVIVERQDAEVALDRALTQRDVVAARIVGIAAIEQAADPDGTLAKLWGSRISSLRALALYRYQSASMPSAFTASETGLFDRSPSVRYLAQLYLATNGFDVRARYIEALTSDAVAVQGLAEVGSADDIVIIEPFLADDRPRMRVAALLAVGRLLASRSRSVMSSMLDDPSPSVVRAAGRVLARQQLPADDLDDLWHRATNADAAGALRRAAFVVFGQQARWPKLVLACRALVSADDDVRVRGEHMLRSVLSAWNRSATDPTPAQIEELRGLGSAACKKVESPTTVRELAGLLKQYGISA